MKQLRRFFAKRILIEKKDSLKPAKPFSYNQRVKKQARIASQLFVNPDNIQKMGKKVINIETMNYYQLMHLIDVDFNNFFSEHQMNINNYVVYLQALLVRQRPKQLQDAFDKMQIYGLKPNRKCYIYLIESYGQNKKLLNAEQTFDTAIEIFGWSIYLVNSLLFTYKLLQQYEKALNLMQQAKLKGLQPNEASYTNLILICSRLNMTNKCWELFEEAKQNKVEIDDFLMGVMIKICGRTQDAEKAIKMWDELQKIPELRLNTLHYSALIDALSTRVDYCERALEIYEELKHKKIQPCKRVFASTLKAAAQLGNVAVAYELALQLRDFGFRINTNISTLLLKTYKNALKSSMLPTKLKERYFEDSWKIVNNLIELKKVNTEVLNNLVDIHIQFNKLLEAEEIVLPLYDSLKIKKNHRTYQMFFISLYRKKELQSIFNLYNKLKSQSKYLISRKSLDIVLNSYYDVMNLDKIIETLDEFIDKKQEPFNNTLITISKSRNIPDSILFRLSKFSFVLKRNQRQRRIYGDSVKLITFDNQMKNKAKQKIKEKQDFDDVADDYADYMKDKMDEMFLDGYDDPNDIQEDEFEDQEDPNYDYNSSEDFEEFEDENQDFDQ